MDYRNAFWFLVVFCAVLWLFQATLRLRVKRLEGWVKRLEDQLTLPAETSTDEEVKRIRDKVEALRTGPRQVPKGLSESRPSLGVEM